ncbi:uncharacterized protein B0H18DRAFT_865765, partial [Fomitopsis serialis]|uniref:uncharacterized protein n=1 Tax=Fomitopsis serialis TaxID=139415 RepID=UPI002007353D
KPSLDQIDHFTKLIVDDMLKFWEPGIYFSQTALYPTGRFALGALLPMICDLSAARQMSGFASHSATYFCSVCHLKQDQIEQIDKHQWSYRSVEEHRRQAEVWRSLDSDAARKAHIKHGFARHTEFLRLPYWDSVRFTVVESMHAHYLNNLKHHIRDTWGMSAKHQSGDGVLWYARKVPACSQKTNAVSWNRILQHLERDTVDQLTKLKYDVLQEIWSDQQRTLLPSCVAPAPTRVGSQKRTLKADEWRSLGTIHLVISLVRLWRFGDERQQAMLDNFIHLVSAIAVAGLHSTSHDHIIAYDHHYQTYLQGFLDLYKEVPLTPSNHMAQHFADKFLAMFGPSHSIRAWAMERVNNTLHNFAKNGKWG